MQIKGTIKLNKTIKLGTVVLTFFIPKVNINLELKLNIQYNLKKKGLCKVHNFLNRNLSYNFLCRRSTLINLIHNIRRVVKLIDTPKDIIKPRLFAFKRLFSIYLELKLPLDEH